MNRDDPPEDKVFVILKHRVNGRLLGFGAPFSIPTRAVRAVWRDGHWIELS